eukprot:CAMPEP_0168530280 /NCGR_PEP_ID=MMETSP0405-20121227/14558_1 /TAXON_ID=498012 /ORGANISM="Trichosphaerium sp, Strain Am-I-7 wt" /LENGTH=270 /DNA_ID=CAMNT_0008554461 /DNA_START=93 /DNA_END=902 /DNA_ORIENTATION=+
MAANAGVPPIPDIIGSYSISSKVLGVGGNATVRLGQHTHTGKPVAVKIVDISNEAVRERTYQEAEVLRKLRKAPNVINLHGVQEVGDVFYMFMDFVRGGTLFNLIQHHGRLDEEEARQIFRSMVHAIESCHSKGIVHHDIKLSNILLASNRSVRLIDFGLCATRGEDDGLIREYAGSPLYMAPEIFSVQPHDLAADIWSLGICLYYMLTDRYPFMASTYAGLEERVLFDDVDFPAHFGLSDNFQDLMSRLLAKNPRDRISLEAIKQHSWW